MEIIKIIVSKHARVRMKERNISELTIRLAILQPDIVAQDKTYSGRFIAKKIVNLSKMDFLLLVVYELKPKEVKIITVIATSKIKKYL